MLVRMVVDVGLSGSQWWLLVLISGGGSFPK